MKIAVLVAQLPPELDAVGQYAARLAVGLQARRHEVSLLTQNRYVSDPIPGVEIIPCFAPMEPASVSGIADWVQANRPDWLVVQYNPFSYGRRGFNLELPRRLRALRRSAPEVRVALMAHEMYVPVENLRFAVMALWQRWQCWTLVQAADTVFVSIEPWIRRVRSRFPAAKVHHLPVWSNIPVAGLGRDEARARLSIAPETLLIGLFGTLHVSRKFTLARASLEAVRAQGIDARLLHLGPGKERVLAVFSGLPVISEGVLPADEVSRRMAALDLALAPFYDGVSSRRGSMMAGLAHGIATVGTDGYATDDMLRQENGRALMLSPAAQPEAFVRNVCQLAQDPDRRTRIGLEGAALYRRAFDADRVIDRMLEFLEQK